MDTIDRCHRAECGAQALVRAQFAAGALFFCGHHWREVASTAGQAARTTPAESSMLPVA